MDEIIYDLCVIGAGMFGSAAARHASANPAMKVCLIGPSEPTVEERPKREIFGAHYDEGRITRVLDDAPACQILSKNSINRYKELEKLSGITFHQPVGCLFMGPRNGRFMSKFQECAATCTVPLVELSNGETFHKRFPYLNLKDIEYALLDDNGGGHISPRNMVLAQKMVAHLQGCHIIDSVVCSAEPWTDGFHVVRTESKHIIRAKRLLIATGAFVNMKELDVLKPLVLYRTKSTVVLLTIPEDEAQRLSSLPSMICARENNGIQIAGYFLPPIKYPNGKYYLKFGKSGVEQAGELKTLEDLRKWYLSDGDEKIVDTHLKFVSELIPGLKFTNISKITCSTCYSPSGLPYIDRVSPTVTVAVAGSGKGAKFSDEVGRIAAHLSITGQWDSELSQNLFRAIFK